MTLDLPTTSRLTPSPEEVICACGLGEGLGDTDVAALAANLRPRRNELPDGESLCQAGDVASCLWLVAKGTVVVTEQADGQAQTVIHRRAPVVVGELGLVRPETRRTATMRASGRVTAWGIPYARLENIRSDALRAALWRNLFAIAAAKLAESVPQRAQQNADFSGAEALLRRFVNPWALAASRTDVRTDYSEVEALVWFSDLVGFSALSRDAAPAQVAAMIGLASTLVSDAIEDEGGYVDKFVGDGVMGWWIVEGREPHHRRTAADAAFRAALRARDAIAAMSALDRPPGWLQIRIGIDHCTAHAGDFGSGRRSAFTLIGDGVNRAARLEQARDDELTEPGARLGAIRVGDALHALLSDHHQQLVPVRVQARIKGADYALRTHRKD